MSKVEIGLFRGLNVGGHNVLPMADLREVLAGLGARDVRTYIQSGNAAWQGALAEGDIADAVARARGFRPEVLVLPLESYAPVVEANPFPEAEADPKSLHLYFLASPSVVDEAVLEAAKGEGERFVLTERALYLHTPKYLSGSKLAPKLERLLGVAATARNWTSAVKILEMARGIAG
ncbi:MAG: DUF1697 domain-containing protein [Rhodobacteraceae bacterium]|nr:DUF1697 domain-containing protein [Paracoccaceae bacterium]